MPPDLELRATAAPQPKAPSTLRAALRLREGSRAGFVAAAAVWLWLLALDVIAASPLHTSGTIGRGILGIIVPGARTPLLADVLAFTVAHFAFWLLLGSLAVRAIQVEAQSPGVLLLAITVLVLLQLATVGITAILAETALHRNAWSVILGGNAVGWLLMGTYLLRRHREIPAELRRDGEA
jgi:hypothetical protein